METARGRFCHYAQECPSAGRTTTGVTARRRSLPRSTRRRAQSSASCDSSWLNQVERWFGELSNKAIRRGSHRSVKELEDAIRAYLDTSNADPIRDGTLASGLDQQAVSDPRLRNEVLGTRRVTFQLVP